MDLTTQVGLGFSFAIFQLKHHFQQSASAQIDKRVMELQQQLINSEERRRDEEKKRAIAEVSMFYM